MDFNGKGWEDFLKGLSADGLGTGLNKFDGSSGEAQPLIVPVGQAPAMEALTLMYLVSIMGLLGDNHRAKRRVIQHLAQMNGLDIARPDRRRTK
jgi:hypothetical protein